MTTNKTNKSKEPSLVASTTPPAQTDKEASMSAIEKLAASRSIIREQAPYLESAIYTMAVKDTPGLGTLGVTANGVLMVDLDWLKTLPVREVTACLVHEALHLLRATFERTPSLVGFDPRNMKPRDLTEEQQDLVARANRSADIAINGDVRDAGFSLPSFGLFAETFGFPDKLTMEQYYHLLTEWDAKNPQKKIKVCICAGHCGSGGGNPLEGEPGNGSSINRTSAELEAMRRAVAEAVRNYAAKGAGTVPGGLQIWAEDFIKPPKVDWRKVLQRAVRHGIAQAEGAVDLRWDGPSRRQAAVGYGPGAPILPRYRAPKPTIDLVVDTSGSMMGDRIQQVVPEVVGLCKAVGAACTLISMDAAINCIKEVERASEITKNLTGGGGTAFGEYFSRLEDPRKRPTISVFFSDGDAWQIPPSLPFSNVKFIQVAPTGCRSLADWFQFIEIND